jgi:hypothetical protein
MQNFGRGIEPPKSFIDVNISSFSHPKSSHTTVITSHPFNFNVNVFIPQGSSTVTTNQLLEKLHLDNNEKQHFYYLCELPASAIVELCQSLLYRGDRKLYAQSVCSNCESSNVIAVYPLSSKKQTNNGPFGTHELVMRLDKDTYERMGLEGTIGMDSTRVDRGNDRFRYVVRRNVPIQPPKQDSKTEGQLNRMKWSLDRAHSIKILLAVYDSTTLNPIDIDENLSSFSFVRIQGYGDPAHARVIPNIPIPPLLTDYDEENAWETHEKFLHWLGIAASGFDDVLIPYNANESSLLCEEVVRPLLDYQDTGHNHYLHIISLCGFIPPHKVLDLLEKLRNLTKELEPPWCTISVSGFQDSPVSFNSLDHGFGMSGENDLTFVLVPTEIDRDAYWLLKSMGSQEQR